MQFVGQSAMLAIPKGVQGESLPRYLLILSKVVLGLPVLTNWVYLDTYKGVFKMTVADIIRDNSPDTKVKIQGRNPVDEFDAFVENYFEGLLSDVPPSLRECEVLSTGWLLGARCHSISIPYQKLP